MAKPQAEQMYMSEKQLISRICFLKAQINNNFKRLTLFLSGQKT